jgi:hypothetical protein
VRLDMTVVVCDFGLARVMKGQIFREQRGMLLRKGILILCASHQPHNATHVS